MPTKPKVSVIVPHYRDLAGLDICLRTLQRQTLHPDLYEVVVADNNSPEGEAAVAKVIAGRARLVIVKEKGAGPARNGAVAASRGEILAFIDSDCQADPLWLEEGLRGLEDYNFIGGKVNVLVDNDRRMTAAEAFERVFAFDFETYIKKKGFTGAGNMFCSRKLFDSVGGFRVGLSEDLEWSRRATSVGYTLGYVPSAIVGHPARRTWGDLSGKWRRINAETYGLSVGQKGRKLKWLARTLALPLSALAHSPKVLASPQLNTFGQRIQALSMLYRLRFWRVFDSVKLLAN